MKKKYMTPTSKIDAVELDCCDMICASGGEVTNGNRYNDPDYEYIEGEDADGWNIGSPD